MMIEVNFESPWTYMKSRSACSKPVSSLASAECSRNARPMYYMQHRSTELRASISVAYSLCHVCDVRKSEVVLVCKISL